MAKDIFKELCAPFPPEAVSWRVGSTTQDKKRGMALAFIDARDVMQRLDDVVGPANWQCRYPHANGKTVCEIGIKIGEEWIWKADGAGDTDVEKEKGALSDAFKRSAVRWGIGRYLYDLESPWVELVPAGRSYAIKPSEHERLRKILPAKIDGAEDEGEPSDRAEVYTQAAVQIIGNFTGTERQLRDWWNDESKTRRDNHLGQVHVDILLGKLRERIDFLNGQVEENAA